MIRLRVEILLAASIAALLFATPLSEAVANQLLIAVCFFGLILFDANISQIKSRAYLLLFIATLITMITASVACSLGGFNQSSWHFLQRYIYPMVLFLVVANANLKFLNERIMTLVIAGGLVLGLCVATPFAIRTAVISASALYFPGIPALNHSGAYVCLTIAALLIMASTLRVQPVPLLSYALSASLVAAGFLTRSRGFILGTISVVLFYLFLLRSNRSFLREAVIAVLGLGLALAVALFVFRDALARMVRDVFSNFFHGRLEIWSDAINLWPLYPACGIGLGQFRDISFNPIYLGRSSGEFYHHAHNIFLNALAEGGILLFISVSIVVCSGVICVAHALRTDPNNRLVWLSFMAFGLFLLFGILDDTVVPPLTLVPSICFGFLYSFGVAKRKL